MIEALLEHAQARPDAPVLVDQGGSLSYRQLATGARAGAAWLHDQGFRAGETVALELGVAQAAQEARVLFALAWLGAPILGLYPESGKAFHARTVPRYARRTLDPRVVNCTGTGMTPHDPRPDRPFFYEFSSGTTGTPKAVLLTAAQCTAVVEVVRLYGWTMDERVLPVLPWPSKPGVRSLMRVIAAGATLVNEPFPETRAELAHLTSSLGVTALRSTPWQLRRLLASPPFAATAPSLRHLDTLGAPIAPHEVQAARDTLCARTWVVYASAEAGGLAYLPPDLPTDAAMLPNPGVEAGAVDQDGTPLPPGTVGDLRFRAARFPAGYADGDVEPSGAQRFRAGWFHPGDLGSVDSAGHVRLVGRSDDVINWGAVKIHPRTIEQVLEQFPGVSEAALVGVPDAMAGEHPVAFIVLRMPIDDIALVQHCRARLNPALVPEHILKLSKMPRNTDGKILREELRKAYEQYKPNLEKS